MKGFENLKETAGGAYAIWDCFYWIFASVVPNYLDLCFFLILLSRGGVDERCSYLSLDPNKKKKTSRRTRMTVIDCSIQGLVINPL